MRSAGAVVPVTMGEGLHLCAAPPPGRAVQRFGLCLMWFLGVFGRQYLPLAAQGLPAPMAQPLAYAVVGPAALTHIRVGMGVNVRVCGRPLDFVGMLADVVVFVCTHAPRVTYSPCVHKGRRSKKSQKRRRALPREAASCRRCCPK